MKPFSPQSKGAKAFKEYGEVLLYFIVIVIVCTVVYKLYKSLKTGSNVIGDKLGNQALSIQTGVPAARIAFIKTLAEDMWNDGVTNWVLTRDYDEQKFIVALNELNDEKEAALISEFYKQSSGESLRSAVNKSFSANDKAKVKSIILQNIS